MPETNCTCGPLVRPRADVRIDYALGEHFARLHHGSADCLAAAAGIKVMDHPELRADTTFYFSCVDVVAVSTAADANARARKLAIAVGLQLQDDAGSRVYVAGWDQRCGNTDAAEDFADGFLDEAAAPLVDQPFWERQLAGIDLDLAPDATLPDKECSRRALRALGALYVPKAVGAHLLTRLYLGGFRDVWDVAKATDRDLLAVPGFGPARVRAVRRQADAYLRTDQGAL